MNYEEFWRRYPEHREEVEERAAIIEIDCNFRRSTAEDMAVSRMLEKYRLYRQGELL